MGKMLRIGFDFNETAFFFLDQLNGTNITENGFPHQNEPHNS